MKLLSEIKKKKNYSSLDICKYIYKYIKYVIKHKNNVNIIGIVMDTH